MLKIALNGARSKEESVNVPHSPEEIEKEVRELFSAGHSLFHIHCYDGEGNESLKPDDINNLVLRIKSISSGISFGISSGEWIEPDLDKRIEYIRGWKHAPDFASVNMIEENARVIAEELIKKGVKVEAGLNEKKAAEIFAGLGSIFKGCNRVLIEPEEEDLIKASSTILEIEETLNKSNITLKRLLHGFNSVAWDILKLASAKGYNARIGLEDTIFLPDGTRAIGNLQLAKEAERLLSGRRSG